MSKDRYYVYLDDEAQCYRETYRVGDRLTDEDLVVFEADKEDQCRAFCQSMNEDWEAATKESLGIELSQHRDEMEEMSMGQANLEYQLGRAVSLIVRLNHEFVLEGVQPAAAEDVEGFWNYVTKAAIPTELLGMAHDDGLPISARELKQREEDDEKGCAECPDFEVASSH